VLLSSRTELRSKIRIRRGCGRSTELISDKSGAAPFDQT
jgi:hypothetical protein